MIGKLTYRKKLLFCGILLVFGWLIVDSIGYYLLSQRWSSNHGHAAPTRDQIKSFVDELYHPKWGWDLYPKSNRGPLGNRKGRDYPIKDRYKIKIFGNSFTQGAVENNQTFQYLIEEDTRWEVLNYGVGGYGTDQAVIKYKDISVKTEYSILGILDENIGRIVTNSWFCYTNVGFWPKPRFVIAENGSLQLVPNPAQNHKELLRLQDTEFVDSLNKGNYWSQYWSTLNAPPEIQWPATLTILKHIDYFWVRAKHKLQHKLSPGYETIPIAKWYHLYKEGSEGIQLMRGIVNEFVKTARQRNEKPIIIIFPSAYTVGIQRQYGKVPYQSLLEHLEEKHILHIDMGSVFSQDENYQKLYDGRSEHFGVTGNKKVAETIVEFITELEH